MRITAIILLTAVLQVSATGNAQGVNISVKNASLEQVFKEIKQQTGYTFFYADNLLQKAKKVTLSVKNTSIEEVLALCFKNQPLSYEIINQSVIIKEKESPNADATNVEVNALINISGKITNEAGQGVVVSVVVKGTNKGTTTNSDGYFELTGVDENATLVITGISIETKEVKLNGRKELVIAATTKITTNPEVIINKGYYSEKQKTSVSSVGKVTAEEIERQPVQNVVLALQGRVPGLAITQNSGISGGSAKVRIQGQNSILNGSDPLYIVDGVPVDAQIPSTGLDGALAGSGYSSFGSGGSGGFGNPLNYLNPLDIESVEVLKDADATAIYGSRAANGAILITTKRGKAGQMKLDVNAETGWGKMTNRMDMMNTRQYLDMRYEAFANDKIDWTSPSVSANDLKLWDTTRYTNWQNELLGGTARYNNINASVSGGTSIMRYLVSGTWHKETTIWPLPTDFADQKASVHFNLNANNNNQKLRMQFSGNYMFDDNQLPQGDLTFTALALEPDAPPLLNSDGSINWAQDANGNSSLATDNNSTTANPLSQQYLKYTNKTHNLMSNLKLDYTILSGLNIGSSFGYNYMQTNDFAPSPLIALPPELRSTKQRQAQFGDRNLQSWIIEPQATYGTKINKGTLDVLVGSTFQNKQAVSNVISGFGQLSDQLLNNLSAAATVSRGLSSTSNYRYNALFGRASYNWNDKYILTMNVRRDGSTRFGADNRFHNFGSVGAAWLFSNETFFKSRFEFLSFGKLRGNYGTTGNDQILDYQFMSLYGFYTTQVPYQGSVGLLPTGLPNPGLEWELTRKLQIGIDLGFFQDKLVINANYVRNRSSNQLLDYRLPTQTGYTDYFTNFPATVQNQNWELTAIAKIVQQKLINWTSSINLTIPRNKLIEFPGLENSTYSKVLHVGEPIDATGYYHWLGVAAGTGDYLFADKNGHPTLTPNPDEDRNVLISKFPKYYGGFENTISYKSIQLDFIFQYIRQNGFNYLTFYNSSVPTFTFPGMFKAGNSNQPVTVLDHWQKAGDNKSVARYTTFAPSLDIIQSDRGFTDLSYLSVKNVSLSYDLSKKCVNKARVRSFRIYVHAQNLLTVSNYDGLNPETQSVTALPPLRIYTLGVQLGL